MRIREREDKKSIDFDSIRDGTVFTLGGAIYIKGDGKYAVNLTDGRVLEPAKMTDINWNNCLIYPRASLSLN